MRVLWGTVIVAVALGALAALPSDPNFLLG